jgi:hypothetical protein
VALDGLRLHTRGVTKIYSREEADEILRRAIALESAEGIRHEDLVSAAREVGIPPEAIDRAAEHLGERAPVVAMVRRLREERRRAFLRHLVVFLVAGIGLFAVDWLGGGSWFFYWPMLIWAIVLTIAGMRQLAPSPERLERQAERRVERQRRREARRRVKAERRRRRDDPRRVEAEFEAAVQQGVTALLALTTKAVRHVSERAERYRVDDHGGDATSHGQADADEGRRSTRHR